MIDHVSYSAWMAWRHGCQWMWKLQQIDKQYVNNYSIHFDFGSCVHFALECLKRRKNRVELKHAHVIFEKKLRLRYKQNSAKYDKPAVLEDFVKYGHTILDRLDDCNELKDAEVVYNEFKLMEDIERTDDVKIKFKGFIDMVIKTKDKRGNTILYVCDFKTCSWGWPREKREDREVHYQVLLYKHFLCKKFDLDPKMVRTAFILLKKRPAKGAPVVEWFPVSAGPVSVQRAIDNLNSDLTDISNKCKDMSFKKDRQYCRDAYGRVCPFFGTERCPGVGKAV